MIWKTRDGHYLVTGEVHPIYTASSAEIRLPSGDVLCEAAEYYEYAEGGTVVASYSQPLNCSLDDWFYVSNIHVVVGAELLRFMWSEKSFEPGTLTADECCLSGLTPYEGPLPFDPAPGLLEYRHRMMPLPPAPWDLPPRRLTPFRPEFAELELLCMRLHARGQQLAIARGIVERIFALVDALEAAHETADALQVGAESVDNTTDIQRYSGVRQHLLAAAREITAACEDLAD